MSFPSDLRMTLAVWSCWRRSEKTEKGGEGTKGLLPLLPPSSTFSWNLTQRDTSRHWSVSSTNLVFIWMKMGRTGLVSPPERLEMRRDVWRDNTNHYVRERNRPSLSITDGRVTRNGTLLLS